MARQNERPRRGRSETRQTLADIALDSQATQGADRVRTRTTRGSTVRRPAGLSLEVKLDRHARLCASVERLDGHVDDRSDRAVDPVNAPARRRIEEVERLEPAPRRQDFQSLMYQYRA